MEQDVIQQHKYRVGSLFAGIGGFCRAFKDEGFNVVWANELDSYACKTYKHNYPETKLYEKSIEDLSVVKDGLEAVDVLTAGFPCQSFSLAGNKLGFDDPRGKLFFEIIRLVKEFGRNRPKIIVLENVKNLIYHNNKQTINIIEEEIKRAGYWFRIPLDSKGNLISGKSNAVVLNTREHTDIPQNRERLYMVAFSQDFFKVNNFKFPEGEPSQKDVREFLDLGSKADSDFYFDVNSKYGKMFADKMAEGNRDSVYLLRRAYVRENKNDCTFTLTANMGEGGHNVPVIHDDWGIRKLTPRECARLQGFKDDKFSFPEGMPKAKQYKQIGNAVTVDLVQKLAAQCMKTLKSVKK
ncbi:DNA (cytosine-5-)-methyltransferase [Paenibacillus sp. JNUCC32]|uniref:DNA cytosine methyltransferase n=1 Tax=Paenibacillus sp. JNUCC32 TaxID=2777984 RepID=UPI00178796D7|nr:DNA (cytosine-5-)-methyltransferase [Paenibacillus sp. JNUCC-32]QOT08467.1 DNA (cytosine-5-)-methyltransferase [Paenibacillus sp. JNUCC-32]